MSPIDADRFRIRDRGCSGIGYRRSTTPPRPKAGEKYVRGPIPLDWLSRAAKLPGRSLHVSIALWFVAGLTRSREVPLSNLSSARFGLDRNAKYRALAWLEKAGLIAVERKLGRAPLVTILETEDSHVGQE